MSWQRKSTESEIVLGQRLATLRKSREMTHLQLGKLVNEKAQQIEKYEKGALIPMAMLEKLAEAMDAPIQKKIIRRITFLRKLEKEEEVSTQEELVAIYSELFAEDIDE